MRSGVLWVMMLMNSVTVLMSTYNGGRYLRQQIDSILDQQGVRVRLLVRDDGSVDDTLDILNDYKDSIKVMPGENIGYAKSFWSLLQMADGTDYYAFSDQDDIWLADKLRNSIDSIRGLDGPALSTGSVIRANSEGVPMEGDPFPTHGPLTLPQALQKSILPGCTFVFNEAARRILAQYNGTMESHDWLAYIVMTALGKVTYVNEPGMLYRLHNDNAVGADGWLLVQLKRLERLFRPSGHVRSSVARDVLTTYWNELDEESRATISELAHYSDSFENCVRLVSDRRFPGTAFRVYALLGRL